MSHEWTVKFVEHRVADRRILRLIQKWLKAGVSEDGQWSESKVGTPQGAVVSPLLANVYLHYVFDLWIEAWRQKVATGDVMVVRATLVERHSCFTALVKVRSKDTAVVVAALTPTCSQTPSITAALVDVDRGLKWPNTKPSRWLRM